MKLKGMKITALGLAASMICAASSAFAGVTAVAAGQTYTLNGAGQHKGTGPDGYSYEAFDDTMPLIIPPNSKIQEKKVGLTETSASNRK